MRPDTIVGYTYKAENVCPNCVLVRLLQAKEASPAVLEEGTSTEDWLDQIAGANAIDRQDERSFDSDEFPKVVFADSVEDDESCGVCGKVLV